MHLTLKALLILPFFVPLCLRADVVMLTDGRTLEGEIISESDTDVVLQGSFGKITLKREEIRGVEKKQTPAALYREKMDAMEKSADASNAEAWLALGIKAKREGARKEAPRAFQHVIQLDPDNAEARKELGYVRQNENWVKSGEVAMTTAEKAAAAAKAADAANQPAAAPTSKERIGSLAGASSLSPEGEKPGNCPKCSGSGVLLMLTCNNCKASDKPGFKFMGTSYEVCQRCHGTTKIVGLYCPLCKGTGKVTLSLVAPSDGGTKKAPSGYSWCSKCDGTGVEIWSVCNQCKRSPLPGFGVQNDRVFLCNRCNGKGSVPALECQTCGGKGVVRAYAEVDNTKQFTQPTMGGGQAPK